MVQVSVHVCLVLSYQIKAGQASISGAGKALGQLWKLLIMTRAGTIGAVARLGSCTHARVLR